MVGLDHTEPCWRGEQRSVKSFHLDNAAWKCASSPGEEEGKLLMQETTCWQEETAANRTEHSLVHVELEAKLLTSYVGE